MHPLLHTASGGQILLPCRKTATEGYASRFLTASACAVCCRVYWQLTHADALWRLVATCVQTLCCKCNRQRAGQRSGATESVESVPPFASTAQCQYDSTSGYLLLECGLLLLLCLLEMCARGLASARGRGDDASKW